MMGSLFERGDGVARNEAEALRWFRLASDQGHPEACFDIAQFYHHGMGGLDEDLAVANSILLVQDGT